MDVIMDIAKYQRSTSSFDERFRGNENVNYNTPSIACDAVETVLNMLRSDGVLGEASAMYGKHVSPSTDPSLPHKFKCVRHEGDFNTPGAITVVMMSSLATL